MMPSGKLDADDGAIMCGPPAPKNDEPSADILDFVSAQKASGLGRAARTAADNGNLIPILHEHLGYLVEAAITYAVQHQATGPRCEQSSEP
jgi:hypothetical protein